MNQLTRENQLRLTIFLILIAASAVSFSLAIVYRIQFGHWRSTLALVRDLVLGLIPYCIAWIVRVRRWSSVEVGVWLLLWLLLFPNSAYLLTQLRNANSFWVLISLYTAYAIIGLFAGVFSLMWVHAEVRERFGIKNGWRFVVVALLCSGIGVYIGRFLDFNSWDALIYPVDVLEKTAELFPRFGIEQVAFVLIYGFLPGLVYILMLQMQNLIDLDRDKQPMYEVQEPIE